ncbi:MAG: hypothetical protein ACYS14_13725 [Planctomycetota bacterium]
MFFVIAQDNKTYARLCFNVGPGGQILIPTAIDYGRTFGPSNHELWDAEYSANITAVQWPACQTVQDKNTAVDHDLSSYALPYDFLDEFEQMEPAERQFILDELADRPDLWDEKGVMVL